MHYSLPAFGADARHEPVVKVIPFLRQLVLSSFKILLCKMFIAKAEPFILRKWSTIRNSSSYIKDAFTISDIPHPVSLPLIGTKLNFLLTGSGTRLHEYVDYRHKKLGPIFYESLGGSTELIFISDASLIKQLFLNLEGKYPMHILPDSWLLYEKLYGSKRGLFFMNGEEWLTNRRILNKILLRENAETWLEFPVTNTIDQFITKWRISSEERNYVPNLGSELYRLSTNVIINILLGSKNSLKKSKHNEELLTLFADTVKKIFQTTTKLYGLPVDWIQKLNLKPWKEFKESVDSSLFLARKLVVEILNTTLENNGLIQKLRDEHMNDEMIVRIAIDFILAAGDTSAYTTQWTLYMIAKHEHWIKEMRTKEKSHVKNVLKESMRLYPVAPFLTRILTKESMLDSYNLHEGTPIIASIYTSGRAEQNFSRADEFLPYRWDRNDPRRQALVNHTPYASLPFAHGARACIGKKIAILQMTEVISKIVNNFDLKCLNTTEVKPITTQVLVPDQEIKILFSPRNK